MKSSFYSSPQKTNLLIICAFIVLVSKPFLFASDNPQNNSATENRALHFPKRGIVDTQPAAHWFEAMISGNGALGALVMGDPYNEQIIFSHGKLFLPWENPIPPVNTAAHLDEIRQMIFEGQYQKAADFVVELSKKQDPGYHHKRWTDPLIPAFDLLIKTHAPKQNQKNYARSVDYETGVVTVKWQDDNGTFERKIFISRADKIAVMQIRPLSSAKINCSIVLAQHPMDSANNYWQPHEKIKQGIKSTIMGSEDGWLWYRCAFAKRDEGYEALAKIIPANGSAESLGSEVLVENADRVLVLLKLELLEDLENSKLDSMRKTLNDTKPDFETLLEKHKQIHTDIYNRVKLNVGGSKENLTAEQLLKLREQEKLSPTLLERVFDADRYTILSCSGQVAPTLQGIWTGTWGTPWSSDYTLNGNVPSAIASYLCGNMPECMQGFFDYMDLLIPGSRINAKRLYNCRGILIASRTSTFGENNHFDRTWPMTFWTAGAGWLSYFFYDYWQYTGDKDFLLNRALPFMKEAALFYEDFLIEDQTGRFVFNPSYSPENAPSNTGSQSCINATMDIAVARELLHNLIDVCEQLKIETNNVKKWKKMLSNMPPYLINEDGALKEWAHPALADNYKHRHNSHLYPLFHGLSPEIAENPELIKACQTAIDKRMEYWGHYSGMAFGLVQIGLSSISLGDNDTVSFVFDRLAKKYHFRVLNSSHDQFNLFNVDIAGGFPAVIIQSLVNFQNDTLYLMPAFPKEFPEGKLEGARCRSRLLIKSLTWNSESIEIELVSEKKQTIDIQLPKSIESATINDKQKITPDTDIARIIQNIKLTPNEPTHIVILFKK